jgi:K+-sensing histidine kinase KdpD
MTKLESGAVKPNLSLYDLHEIVRSALRGAGKILASHHVLWDNQTDAQYLAALALAQGLIQDELLE